MGLKEKMNLTKVTLFVLSCYKQILWEHDEHKQPCHPLAPGVKGKDRKITSCFKYLVIATPSIVTQRH